jgi:hypothetical protein
MQINGDNISIKFLDEQLNERGYISQVNSVNGSKGGRPKAAETLDEKPTALTSESEPKAKESNIEEEQKRKELEKKIKLDNRKLKFALTLEPFKEIYPREMLKAFLRYWAEPNKSGTRIKWELEKTWDIEGRLETWASRDKSFKKEPTEREIIYNKA